MTVAKSEPANEAGTPVRKASIGYLLSGGTLGAGTRRLAWDVDMEA
jgi:hypothetical protein